MSEVRIGLPIVHALSYIYTLGGRLDHMVVLQCDMLEIYHFSLKNKLNEIKIKLVFIPTAERAQMLFYKTKGC